MSQLQSAPSGSSGGEPEPEPVPTPQLVYRECCYRFYDFKDEAQKTLDSYSVVDCSVPQINNPYAWYMGERYEGPLRTIVGYTDGSGANDFSCPRVP